MENRLPTATLLTVLIICIAFALMLLHMHYKHKENMAKIQMPLIEQPITKSRGWK